jgi:hypothetical protein
VSRKSRLLQMTHQSLTRKSFSHGCSQKHWPSQGPSGSPKRFLLARFEAWLGLESGWYRSRWWYCCLWCSGTC